MNHETIAIIGAISLALTQVVKKVLDWSDEQRERFMPLFSIGFGLALSWMLLPNLSLQDIVINGLIAGLSASGLFDATAIIRK